MSENPSPTSDSIYRAQKQAHIDAVCGSQPIKDSGDYAVAEASWFLIQCEFHVVADNLLRAWKAAKQTRAPFTHPREIMAASTDAALLNMVMVLTGGSANPETMRKQIERYRARLTRSETADAPGADTLPETPQGDGTTGAESQMSLKPL